MLLDKLDEGDVNFLTRLKKKVPGLSTHLPQSILQTPTNISPTTNSTSVSRGLDFQVIVK